MVHLGAQVIERHWPRSTQPVVLAVRPRDVRYREHQIGPGRDVRERALGSVTEAGPDEHSQLRTIAAPPRPARRPRPAPAPSRADTGARPRCPPAAHAWSYPPRRRR